MKKFFGITLFLSLLVLMCSSKNSTNDVSTSASQYGSANVSVKFPSNAEFKKLMASGGYMEFFVLNGTDTLHSNSWTFPDTMPKGYQTGPLPACKNAIFIINIFDGAKTLTHKGIDTTDIVSGASVELNINILSLFGSINTLIRIPNNLKNSISGADLIVEADDFSPKIKALVINGDSAIGSITDVLAGKNRIITVKVYTTKNKLIYQGKDTADLVSDLVVDVNFELKLVGAVITVVPTINNDGVINARPFFSGQDTVDNSSMVFVPSGNFIMDSGSLAHQVYLDSFYIDKYEVTNEDFVKFLNSSSENIKYYRDTMSIDTTGGVAVVKSGTEKLPIAFVEWYGANAFCLWSGKKLPSDSMWEKAARGDDLRTYPWGNTEPDSTYLNYSSSNIKTIVTVGSYIKGKSFYGAFDMSGNVYEWCCTKKTSNYIRKGGAYNSTKNYCVTYYSGSLSAASENRQTGFRCVKQ